MLKMYVEPLRCIPPINTSISIISLYGIATARSQIDYASGSDLTYIQLAETVRDFCGMYYQSSSLWRRSTARSEIESGDD